MADLVLGKSLSLLWQILNSIEKIINVENGQILNKQSSHLWPILYSPYDCNLRL